MKIKAPFDMRIDKEKRRKWNPKPKKQYGNEHTSFYQSARWRRARKGYLQKQPLCEVCKETGRITEADVVDHIVRLKDGGNAFDEKNFMSLCHPHHNVKRGKERHKDSNPGVG